MESKKEIIQIVNMLHEMNNRLDDTIQLLRSFSVALAKASDNLKKIHFEECKKETTNV